MQKNSNFSRREFLKTTTAGAAAISAGIWTGVAPAASKSANEKLNIACIGTANRAAADVDGVKGENIVALVDVDSNYLDRASASFPNARLYADYREMLESEEGKIDAVVIGTTDHHHAPATIRAIRKGLHVYCEKPLTHTVQEARIIAEEAKKQGVATQLGTQIHAG
ncbi:MAG: Gfo/Idh/MocA family oxidoreductase, partial [Planctomycetaceae bacterium]|nr:Gfo/Idh/MocA family oxidoreductase [Planctomycetaceae bacterium]